MTTPKITCKVETIDPRLAKKYLATMVLNRRPKEDTISQYCNDMVTGKWLLSPQGIAFDEDDHLFEGQHRMLAVIRAGIPVTMLVLRGFPVHQQNLKTMDIVDSGVGRSLADRLKLMGCYHGNPNLASAAARQISGIVMGINCRVSRKLSISGVVEILRLWKQEMQAVCSVLDRPQFKPFRNGHVLAAFTLAAVADIQRLDLDMARITTGANLDADSPLLELRNLFLVTDSIPPREKTGLTLAALYAAWHDIPGKAFYKPAVRADAAEFFRAAQPKRYAQVAKLFHTTETTATTP